MKERRAKRLEKYLYPLFLLLLWSELRGHG
jgi:hypothetical protein